MLVLARTNHGAVTLGLAVSVVLKQPFTSLQRSLEKTLPIT